MRIASGVVAVFIAGLLLLAPHSAAPSANAASTCTLVQVPDPWERLDIRLDYLVDVVLVGTVRSERLVNSGPTPEYESTISVDMILRGSLSGDEVMIPFLSDTYNCGTSPRLREGNRVLLVLRQIPESPSPISPHDAYWEIGPTGGSIFFGISGALLKDYQSDTGDSYLGENEAVIRYVAARVGASEADTTRAIAVISGDQVAAGGDDSRLYFAAGLLALILAAAVVFVAREQRAQDA